MIPVISVVGYANSGKTTLLVKLIRELKQRGLKIATVKHHHKDFDIDLPGKDTWKHAEAGADIVVMAANSKVAVIEKSDTEITLDEVLEKIKGVDLIITEGYKHENRPKIEVFRSTVHEKTIFPPEQLLAVASDVELSGVPTFALDDAKGLADFLVEKFLKNQ